MRPPSLKLSVIGAVSAVVAGAVSLTVLLTQAKFESHVFALVEDRLSIVLEEAAEPIRFALGLGLGLDEMADLRAVIARARPDGIDRIAIAATDAAGSPVTQVPDAALESDRAVRLEAALEDGFGRPAGRLELSFHAAGLHDSLRAVRDDLRRWGLLIAGAVAGLAVPALWLAVRRSRRISGTADGEAAHAAAVRRLTWRTVGAAGILMLAGAAAVSVTAWRQYAPIVGAELDAQAETIGAGLQRQIGRALEVGIPIDRLVGVEAVFAEELAASPDVRFLALSDGDGRLLYGHGLDPSALAEALRGRDDDVRVVALPLTADGERLGILQIGVPADYARQVGLDLLIDVGSVLAVSCLLGVELLLFVLNRAAAQHPAPSPAPGSRRVNPVMVRLPILLFALGEELSRPFLPLFAGELAGPDPWVSRDLATALPITLFMMVWALSQPWGAAWSERAGRRRIFLIGAVASAAGLAATAVADSLATLLVYRAVTAVGYGLVLIGAQGMIIDNTPPADRAMGMATLVGGLLAAAVCGPVLGGVVAEQAGPRWAFAGGAGLAIVSMLVLVLAIPRDGGAAERTHVPRIHWGEALRLLGTARFAALMAFSAVPTKLAAVALLFYLIPMILAGSGAGPADIGRVQTLYFVAFIVVSPLAAYLSDRTGRRRAFLAWGGIGTLIAVVPLGFGASLPLAAVSMALFGVAQSLISAPQLVLVGDVARSGDRQVPESVVLAIFRLVERTGAMVAPALAAALAMAYGFRAALIGIGAITAVASVVFLLVFHEGRAPQRTEDVPEAP